MSYYIERDTERVEDKADACPAAGSNHSWTMAHGHLKLWLLCVALGFAILFFTTRLMLGDVRRISEVAAHIGESDLSERVPAT